MNRITGGYSLHDNEDPSKCPNGHGLWRTVDCDGERDIVECANCGKQRQAVCNFDEEFA